MLHICKLGYYLSIKYQVWNTKIHQLNINYATYIAVFSRFRINRPNCQTETMQVWILHAKYKKCGKSIMDSAYVLWTHKIHCLIPKHHKSYKINLASTCTT